MHHTWEFGIQLPGGGGYIHVTASGSSEYDAMRAVQAQYPGAKIVTSKRIS